MKKGLLISAIAVSVLLSCGKEASLVQIEEAFSGTVPADARPWVWWHWMDGNITRDGIRKDLQWMKDVGIAGFHQFDVGGRNTPIIVEDRVSYLSPGWHDAFSYAMHIADSLGLETGVASCPGWSGTGGPWVTRENAMKKLVWRTMETSGGDITLTLPEPMTTVGKYLDVPYEEASDIEPWYRDIAAVAVRIPGKDRNMKDMCPEVSSSDGDFTLDMLSDGRLSTFGTVNPGAKPEGRWIEYRFPSRETFCAVTIADEMMRSRYIRFPADVHLILECSDDGTSYREAARIPDSVIYGMTMDFPPKTASIWRLRIIPGTGKYREEHSIRDFVLHTVSKVNHAQEKAGFAAQDDFMSYPTPHTDSPVEDVVVLGLPAPDGTIKCILPEGKWRVYRFGQSLTGKKNHPTSPDATGLEVDKLDREAWLEHFRQYLLLYPGGIGWLLNDSYEAEQMTWTRDMQEHFRALKGYDLLPWLPALTGEIIGSSEETERFLWDWRDVIGTLFSRSYDSLSEIIREFNLKGRFTESHEDGRLFVGDGMDPKIKADIPMSAIWMSNAPGGHNRLSIGEADIRESASVSHIWGQKYVAAESFTVSGAGRRGYTYCPENLKFTADVALHSGLNRFVIHESAHQPLDDKVPGTGLFQYGQWFHRHETWASMARPWLDYLSRSCYILQQGRSVADILLYYGEDNCIVGLYGYNGVTMPDGYSFDYINPTGIKEAVKVKGGKLTVPSGASYQILVLGENCRRMSLPVLRRLVSLADKGAWICGTLPEEPAGINDNTPEFRLLQEKLSQKVHRGTPEEVLDEKGIEKDFSSSSSDIKFVHRSAPEADFYWVRNFGKKDVTANICLRTRGAESLEIWDPETGKRFLAENFEPVEGGIRTSLAIGRDCAMFLVARKGASALQKAPLPGDGLFEINGPWEVSFQKGRGAPEGVIWENLEDWSTSPDEGIRYFSGTALYSTTFTLEKEVSKAWIDLGKVKNIAEVSINGINVGTAWRAPFVLEIPRDVLKEGENTLTVKVANLWVNRLIGDARGDDSHRYTTTPVVFYRENDKLLPSGLLGPVNIKY